MLLLIGGALLLWNHQSEQHQHACDEAYESCLQVGRLENRVERLSDIPGDKGWDVVDACYRKKQEMGCR